MPFFFSCCGRGKCGQVSSAVCKTWSCVQNLVLCAKLHVSSGLVVGSTYDHVFIIYCFHVLKLNPILSLFILFRHVRGNFSHMLIVKMKG